MKKKQLKRINISQIEIKKNEGHNYILPLKEPIIDLDNNAIHFETIATMNENPFLSIMETILDTSFEMDQKLDWMIKVSFPDTTTQMATLYLKENNVESKVIRFNNSYYYLWLSTSSGMKTNDVFYIREDMVKNIQEFESIISCKWIENLKEAKINKDVTSRISLALSSSYKTSIKPNFLVLPEEEYKTMCRIKTFENDEFKIIDKELGSIFADGSGICSPAMMERISKEIGINYTPYFATVRVPKLATKGLLVSIDYIKYFNDNFRGNTEFFEKRSDGYFYARDTYNQWVRIDNNTIIVNESMCKWSKHFNSIQDYEYTRDSKYADIMDNLFVIKTSKEVPDKYKTTSYQLLCQLAITPNELDSITTKSFNFLKGVLNSGKEEVMALLNLIEDDDKNINLNNKIKYLLSVDYDKFIKVPFIRKDLLTIIENRITDLMSGKFIVEGKFATITSDPLAMLDYVMTRNLNGVLDAYEFWNNGDTKEVLACRYPLASFSEVGKMQFIDNSLYSKYCSHWTSELVVFNAKDIRSKLLSGADFDGDSIFITPEKELVNSIIPPKDGIHFISTEVENIETSPVEYTWGNRIYNNLAYSGNIIGEIAILNSCISNSCQNLGVYNNETNTNISKKDLFDVFVEHNNLISITDEARHFFNEWYYSQNLTSNLLDADIKNIIINQFYDKEVDIYKTVETSMIAIDSPKTGYKLSETHNKFIKDLKKEYKRPYYHLFLNKNKAKCYQVDSFVDESVLSNYCKKLYFTLLTWYHDKIENTFIKGASYLNTSVITHFFSNTYNSKEVEVHKCYNSIKLSFNEDVALRNERDKPIYKVDANGETHVVIHDKYEKLLYNKKRKFKALTVSSTLIKEYDMETICSAIYMLMTENLNGFQKFIFDYYFFAFEHICNSEYEEVEFLRESPEGKRILFSNYVVDRKSNKDFFTISRKEQAQFYKFFKIKNPFNLRVSRINNVEIKDFVRIKVVPAEKAVYLQNYLGETIGIVFSEQCIKNDLNLFNMHGVKLIIDNTTTKVNDRSYGLTILGSEV